MNKCNHNLSVLPSLHCAFVVCFSLIDWHRLVGMTAASSSSPSAWAPSPTRGGYDERSALRASASSSDGRVSSIDFKSGWETLKRDGVDVVVRSASYLEFEPATGAQPSIPLIQKSAHAKLYSLVYAMSTQKAPKNWAGKLYHAFKEEITLICETTIRDGVVRGDPDKLLPRCLLWWEKFGLILSKMSRIFRYVDRFYVARLALPTLWQVGIDAFRDRVFTEVETDVTAALLDQVAQIRQGRPVNESIVRDMVSVYVQLGGEDLEVYDKFETLHLAATKKHVIAVASRALRTCSCPDYLSRAETTIRLERRLVDECFHKSTMKKIVNLCNEHILAEHQERVVGMKDSGCMALLRENDRASLRLMTSLFKGVPNGLSPLAEIFLSFLLQVGGQLVDDFKPAEQRKGDLSSTVIGKAIAMHEDYLGMLDSCFLGNNAFHRSLKESFEDMQNKPLPGKQTMSEYLADYIDRRVRRSSDKFRGASPGKRRPDAEDEMLRQIENALKLFAYVHDKDMFLEFYRKQMAKRLLLGRSASNEAEKAMVGMIKSRCGAAMVSKLWGMLKDQALGGSVREGFEEYVKDGDISIAFDANVQVLTSGYWPSYKSEPLHLDETLSRAVAVFEEYYRKRTLNRNLRWIYALGSITICGHFQQKSIDIVVNTFQASVLLLFNSSSSCTMEEIADRTGMHPDLVKKHIVPLCFGKYKILEKSPGGMGDVDPQDAFAVNAAFTDKARRIRIPMVLQTKNRDADKTRARNVAKLTEERKFAMEAIIVKTMKAHRTMNHNDLVAAVSGALLSRFRPDPKDIKRTIEHLIDREYIDRDEADQNVYEYVA